MKQYSLTVAFLILCVMSPVAKPIDKTLDGNDFLSVSDVRQTVEGAKTGYTVPETGTEISSDVDLLIHFDADGEVPEGNYIPVKGAVLSVSDFRKIGTGSGRFYTNENRF